MYADPLVSRPIEAFEVENAHISVSGITIERVNLPSVSQVAVSAVMEVAVEEESWSYGIPEVRVEAPRVGGGNKPMGRPPVRVFFPPRYL
jgi:hypothetical protein